MTEVVLVHGLAGSSRWWAPIAERLRPEHDVHVVDLPRRLTLPDTVDWLAGWIEENLGCASLVGHSRGGLVAASVAAARPDVVERLVLVAPAGTDAPSSRRAQAVPFVRAVRRTRLPVLGHLARDALLAGPRTLWRESGEVVRAPVGDLGAITAPTLVVWGDRDPILPPERTELFLSAIPGAQAVVLPGAAHVPMYEAPDALSEALLDFLA